MLPCNQKLPYDMFYCTSPLVTKGYQVSHVLWYWYHCHCWIYYWWCGLLPLWIDFHLLGTVSVLIAAVIVRMYLCAINNCGNESVLFGVIFVSDDWSSFPGGSLFLVKSLIYRLSSSWIIYYTLSSIAAQSRPFLFPIPPGGIAYINTILILISIFFASSSATSSSTPTAASFTSFCAASPPSSTYPRWFDLLSPSKPSWQWLVLW